MINSSRKPRVVYTIPMFSQECVGTYARFHDVIHTLQRMDDPAWEYIIVPLRRYYGKPSPNVLFQNGGAPFRLTNFLRNVIKASRDAHIVHVVQGDFPYSLLVPLIVKGDVPIVAGPNVIRVGTDPEWVIHTQGGFKNRRQELAIRFGFSIHFGIGLPSITSRHSVVLNASLFSEDIGLLEYDWAEWMNNGLRSCPQESAWTFFSRLEKGSLIRRISLFCT